MIISRVKSGNTLWNWRLVTCAWLSLGLVQQAVVAETPVDFEVEVAPIFSEHCVSCHDPATRKGEVSLATMADLKSFDYVIPGDPEGSYLLDLVTAVDGKQPEMPKDNPPLEEAEVELLRRWISEGANWPEQVVVKQASKVDASWWSLQPIATDWPMIPAAKPFPTASVNNFSDDSKTRIDTERLPPAANRLDVFIDAKLREHGLKRNLPADRRTLIRRATYDLIGLPPTPEEVKAFENDPSAQAYANLVDQLLESPHYGERWGRHWLDVVRFGESIGFERNVINNEIWPFRDYVIRSLNSDKPFNQFIREHLAGDVIAEDRPEVAVGSAYLVAGPYDDVGNQDAAQAAQIRANTLDEIINATGQAFLGLTLGCARCHDHKFDPITQEDYYGLYATFAGIRHGSVTLATAAKQRERDALLQPLQQHKQELLAETNQLKVQVLERAHQHLDDYQSLWKRPAVDRRGTEEKFKATQAKFVRLICEALDNNPTRKSGFRIDEFEIWSAVHAGVESIGFAGDSPREAVNTNSAVGRDLPSRLPQTVNVALSSNGGKASGEARRIEDFPGAYGPQLTIDGETGAGFIAAGDRLTIELASPTWIERIVFSSAKDEPSADQPKFTFVADYRLEVSMDCENWREVAHGRDRQPVGPRREFVATRAASTPDHLEHRLLQLGLTDKERRELKRLQRETAEVNRRIEQIPDLPQVWIGRREAADAEGPFHVFLGGNPQKPADEVVPSSLAVLSDESNPASHFSYRLSADTAEADRRQAFAEWIVNHKNPLTARVLVNRIWQYHFGMGIVDTPNDFGFMGGSPTHPELLDWLAGELIRGGWRIKRLHRLIMCSETYRQASTYNREAAAIDADARFLWRFPPRRLSAEEIRDSILQHAGQLDRSMGGPGFRLYHFMQDNVCTYVPLDKHGPETYRRAVYHQNARASVVDLMTDFDQPDCAFSSPKRAETTTPLQALTMLNHRFTSDMAEAMAARLRAETGGNDSGSSTVAQVRRAYQLCYARLPTAEELSACTQHINRFGLAAICRVLLNTSEMIYVR